MSINLEFIIQQCMSASWEHIDDDYFQRMLVFAKVSKYSLALFFFLTKRAGKCKLCLSGHQYFTGINAGRFNFSWKIAII